MRRSLPVLLVIVAFPVAAQDAGVHVAADHGFRIERPDDGWRFEEQGRPGGKYTLVLRPAPVDDGRVRVLVMVEPAGSGADATAVRDAALASIENDPAYVERSSIEGTLAGRKAPGLRVVYRKRPAPDLVARQFHLVEDGLVYRVQALAPASEVDRLRATFERTLASFALVPLPEEATRRRALERLADRCGSEIDWAADWPAAARRAAPEGRLVLVALDLLSAFSLTDAARVGPLMDPDVVALVQERFVALRYRKGMDAPFVDPSVYGLSGTSFGRGFLVLTAGGRVVGDTFGVDSMALDDFLRRILADHPGPGTDLPAENLAAADLLARRGDLERALETLGQDPAPRLRAACLRRLGRLEEALAAVAGARSAGDRLERGLVELRLGRFDEARATFERALADSPGEHEPALLYWLASAELRRLGPAAARRRYLDLIERFAGDRWAWRAAGVLSSTGFSLGSGERLDRPPAALRESLRIPVRAPLPGDRAAEARAGATRYLLEHQRSDGTWVVPHEAIRFRDVAADPFVDATTSLAGLALLATGDEASTAAAGCALSAVLARHESARRSGGAKAHFMDYRVWGQSMSLLFLARCRQVGLGDGERILEVADSLVEDLSARQRAGGGWSYYLTTDLASEETDRQSISFVTAAVVIALLAARETGAAVDVEVLRRGALCLEAMRGANGAYEYMLAPGARSGAGPTLPGAAGRGPLCSLALHRAGRLSTEEVERSLDQFVAHRRALAAEQGKSMMHAGADGQGCHYLLFDYAMAAAAVRALPAAGRGPYREPLLEVVLAARIEGGAFLDAPFLGPAYGAAMAVLALRGLE